MENSLSLGAKPENISVGIRFVALNEIGWNEVGACQGSCLHKNQFSTNWWPSRQGCAGQGFFFLVECSLLELGGHALETGGTTARIVLESWKFLRLNVPWVFIYWDFPSCLKNFCHLVETSFVYTILFWAFRGNGYLMVESSEKRNYFVLVCGIQRGIKYYNIMKSRGTEVS